MAAAVVISTFVALSLCPMIASRVLKPSTKQRKRDGDSDSVAAAAHSYAGRVYRSALGFAINAPLVVIAISLIFVAGAVVLYAELPRELAPKEDRGVAIVPITAPQGATVAYTNAQARIIEKAFEPQVTNGNIDTVYSLVGWGNGPYRAFVVMRLALWGKREASQAEIVSKVQPAARGLAGARAAVASPAGLGLRGNSKLLEHAEANDGLINPQMDFEENQPQLDLKLDRARQRSRH